MAPVQGSVGHFEIPADDVKRATKFYQKTFGWGVDTMPDGSYSMLRTTATSEDGRPKEIGSINGGMLKRQPIVPHVTVTIIVPDIDRAAKEVAANGGKITRGKEEVPEFGWAAYFTDTEGNVIGLFQPKGMP